MNDEDWKEAINRAEHIWEHLDEEYMVGVTRWKLRVKLEDSVPDAALRRLEASPPSVAVEVIRLLKERRSVTDRKGVVAARRDYGASAWGVAQASDAKCRSEASRLVSRRYG